MEFASSINNCWLLLTFQKSKQAQPFSYVLLSSCTNRHFVQVLAQKASIGRNEITES